MQPPDNRVFPPASTGLWPAILLPAIAEQRAADIAALTESQWEGMTADATKHGLAPLLYANLQRLSVAQREALPTLETLRTAYRASTVQAMRREGELRRVLDGLADAGVRPTLFKGAALAYTAYPTPACRPMGDIDLWVMDEEMPGAMRSLETLGYEAHEKENRPHALMRATDGEVQMRPGNATQGLVELHWGVFAGEWLARTTAVDRPGVRSRRIDLHVSGRTAYTLATEDALIQLAVHMGINHQMSLHPLRSLVDIALLSTRPVDWEQVIQRVRAWRVATVTGVALALARDLFGLADLAEPAAALAPSGLQRKVLERFVTPQAVLARPDLSSHKSRFAYLLAVTDRRRDSVHLLARTLWPEHTWLDARYGRSGWSTRLRHMASAFYGHI